MKTLDSLTNFSEVEKIVRESLVLDGSIEITPDTTLIELGAEPIDVLDNYSRLGMKFSDYTSGERIKDNARIILRNIAGIKVYEEAQHFFDLADSKTTNEFINNLKIADLVDIQSYEATHLK